MAKIIAVYGYEGLYTISEEGDVFGRKGNKLKPFANRRGYYSVRLYREGVSKDDTIHRLVAKSFLGFQKEMTVNHKDNNKKNNHISNLEWMSNADNLRHSFENGYRKNMGHKKGITYAIEKTLLDKIVDEWIETRCSIRKIARKYGVGRSTLQYQINNNY